jgi:hypothetical protein
MEMQDKTNNRMDILVQRQLEDMGSGNGAYLEMFLRQAKRAGLDTRVVFAPLNAFGNRPWSFVHDKLDELIDEVEWPASVKIGRYFISLSPRVWARFGKRLFNEVRIRLGYKLTIQSYLGRLLDASESSRMVAVCNASPSRYVIAEYSSMGPLLADVQKGTKGVLMHDLLSARAEQFRAHGVEPDFQVISRQTEAHWVNHAGLLVYASANEMASFASFTPSARAVWLRPEPQSYPVAAGGKTPRIVFLGTQHAGNSDALQHFLGAIWPLVRQMKPDAKFSIAGSIGATLDATALAAQGVTVLGRLDDLMSIAGPDNIGIAPTRLATGVSIKVAEYLMLGMPCVVYPHALQGFGKELDALVLKALDPQAYAEQLVRLLEDDALRASLSRRAYQQTPAALDNSELVELLRDGLQSSVDDASSAPMVVNA